MDLATGQPQRPSREGFREGATGEKKEKICINQNNSNEECPIQSEDQSQSTSTISGTQCFQNQEPFVPEPFVGGGFGSTF